MSSRQVDSRIASPQGTCAWLRDLHAEPRPARVTKDTTQLTTNDTEFRKFCVRQQLQMTICHRANAASFEISFVFHPRASLLDLSQRLLQGHQTSAIGNRVSKHTVGGYILDDMVEHSTSLKHFLW